MRSGGRRARPGRGQVRERGKPDRPIFFTEPEPAEGGRGAVEPLPETQREPQAPARPVSEPETPAGHWIEIRPFQTRTPESFARLLDYFYNSGETFEFLVNSMPCERGQGYVRYFIRTPSPEHSHATVSVLEGMGVHAFETDPPEIEGPAEGELEMAGHYFHPLAPFDQRQHPSGVPESLAQILKSLRRGGALRVAFRPDPRAKTWAYMEGRRLARLGSNPGGAFVDVAMGLGGAFAGGSRARAGRRSAEGEARARAYLDAGIRRSNQKLFACDLRAYGTEGEIASIANTLPSSSNRIKVFRTRSVREERKPRPSRNRGRAFLKKLSLGGIPLSLAPLWRMGIFNPLEPGTGDWILLSFFLGLSVLILVGWRLRKPTVLSADELALIFSLPKDPSRLPLMFAPISSPRKPYIEEKEAIE